MVTKNSFYKCLILDELEFIDWGKDSDSSERCDGSEKDDNTVEISDSDSCTSLNSLPIQVENDELCEVRNSFKFKKEETPSTTILEGIHIQLSLFRGAWELCLPSLFIRNSVHKTFKAFSSDCQTSNPSGAPHVELGHWITGWLKWEGTSGRQSSQTLCSAGSAEACWPGMSDWHLSIFKDRFHHLSG